MLRTNLDLLNCIEKLAIEGYKEPHLQLTKIKPGECFVRQGEVLHFVYIIKTGVAKCFITEENGKNFILEFFGEGEIIGEVELLKKTVIFTNVEAMTELTVYRISVAYCWKLLEINQEFNRLLLVELATRLQHTAMRASYQQVYPIEYAVLRLIYLFSHHPFNWSKHNLADYLGITIRSLNRTFKLLREKDAFNTHELGWSISKKEIGQWLDEFEKV